MERKLEEIYSEFYLAKCQKRLKEWRAPLDGWYCKKIIDVREDDEEAPLATCELCDCSKVRFIHVMDHKLYFEEICVGCICAGVMQGDILAAKERERQMKNRAKRRKNFVAGEWKETASMGALRTYTRMHRGQRIWISVYPGNRHYVRCNEKSISRYKGRPIRDFYSAVYAAFDLADPVEELL